MGLKNLSVMILVAAMLTMTGAGARAGLMFVDTRQGLAAADFVDWGNSAPENANLPNPFNATSNNGLGIAVSIPSGVFTRWNQSTSFFGNFAPGDRLLGNHSDPFGPISIRFAVPVRGTGAQIMQEAGYYPFTGVIQAFDAANNSLGIFTEASVSTSYADNSAIFLGVRSDIANIAKITFDVQGGGYYPTINRLDVVPEPSTLAMLGIGAINLLFYVWRRRKRTS